MVRAVRQGESLRTVARRFHVSLSTVHYWTERAEGKRLSRVDWQDRSQRPHRIQRTKRSIENLVIRIRTELKDRSILGEYGAEAIQRDLVARGKREIPAIRTIGRILERRGALDGRHRRRHPPPPAGWYCLRWPSAAVNSIASMLSKAWSSKVESTSKSSTPYRCTEV